MKSRKEMIGMLVEAQEEADDYSRRPGDDRRFPHRYVLDGHEPVRAEFREWGAWLESVGGVVVVANTWIAPPIAPPSGEAAEVSTVFLGMDHQYHGGGPALLFETMVFGGPLDGEQERYSTWEEAEAGHARTVEAVKAGR